MTLRSLFAALCLPAFLAAATPAETARWTQHAKQVTIVRDDWGIAHISGKSDADAVFGMIYAQAEDDFNRVETNYLTSLGRTAEAEGQSKIYQDLRQRLFLPENELRALYAKSPASLQKLMNAWADGLNFYLSKHPGTKPKVLTHFEPWMALSFTEGSIGGDIERISLRDLEKFYGHPAEPQAQAEVFDPLREPVGSNGAAVAPANTASHHALLLINPHTSFFFRSELQMTSEEGLNAYGAVTWGQFFIYQGFNDRAGWMHTSSGVDAIDEYLETVTRKGSGYVYQHGSQQRPVKASTVTIAYKDGVSKASKSFTVYHTHHGPVIREQDGKWVSIALMNIPIPALMQSYGRTKARNYAAFRKTMELKGNSSNNTIYADADGTIAYFHGNFIPRRDTHFDFTHPVDGSNPATDWKGLHTLDEIPTLLNPSSGWLYNSNNSPWSAAGESSPTKEKFPVYVESGKESARGRHAIKVLENRHDFTLDSFRQAAYDTYLPWFEKPIPALLKAWESAPEPEKSALAAPVQSLRDWDLRWAEDSVPTSLAVFWAEELVRQFRNGLRTSPLPTEDYLMTQAKPADLLSTLAAARSRLENDFGTWQTPWGGINRFQRLTGDIVQPFNDAAPSTPVGFVSGNWGSLASFGAKPYPGTKKWYGTSGNSFVAVVEFGPRVKALAVTAGGESGSPKSTHFNDEATRYAKGDLREVYFYKDQLKDHTERTYHPGE